MFERIQTLLDAGKLLCITLSDGTELFLEPGDEFDLTGGYGYHIGSGNSCTFDWSEVTDVLEER